MFRDCWRCGHGWRDGTAVGCPVCHDIPEHVAQYILDMRTHMMQLRRVAGKAILGQRLKAKDYELAGIYITDQCDCDWEPGAQYPACPHDNRGPVGATGVTGVPALKGV